MRPDYHAAALEWADRYGPIVRFSLGGQHVVLVSDPALAAAVLGRGAGSLPRKTVGYGFFDLVRCAVLWRPAAGRLNSRCEAQTRLSPSPQHTNKATLRRAERTTTTTKHTSTTTHPTLPGHQPPRPPLVLHDDRRGALGARAQGDGAGVLRRDRAAPLLRRRAQARAGDGGG